MKTIKFLVVVAILVVTIFFLWNNLLFNLDPYYTVTTTSAPIDRRPLSKAPQSEGIKKEPTHIVGKREAWSYLGQGGSMENKLIDTTLLETTTYGGAQTKVWIIKGEGDFMYIRFPILLPKFIHGHIADHYDLVILGEGSEAVSAIRFPVPVAHTRLKFNFNIKILPFINTKIHLDFGPVLATEYYVYLYNLKSSKVEKYEVTAIVFYDLPDGGLLTEVHPTVDGAGLNYYEVVGKGE